MRWLQRPKPLQQSSIHWTPSLQKPPQSWRTGARPQRAVHANGTSATRIFLVGNTRTLIVAFSEAAFIHRYKQQYPSCSICMMNCMHLENIKKCPNEKLVVRAAERAAMVGQYQALRSEMERHRRASAAKLQRLCLTRCLHGCSLSVYIYNVY